MLLILGGIIFSCGRKTVVADTDEVIVEQQDESTVVTQTEILEAVTEEYEEGEPEPVFLLCELKRSTCYGKCPAYHIKLYSATKME